MKKLILFVFLFTVSCGSSPDQLFETAELEMLQTNYPHATKLYQEILAQHPNSEFAEKARKRLKEIKGR